MATMTTTPVPNTPTTTKQEIVRPPRPRPSVGKIAAWVAMAAIMLITLLPFYWILRTALSTNTGLAAHPSDPLPVDFTTGGFERALGLQSTKEAIAQGGAGGGLTFWRYLLNSVIVSTLVTVCQVFFSAMAAYAFARLRWRGRDRMFGLFLAGPDGPGDLHPAAELRPDQATRARGHPVGDRAADDVHDAVRGVLPQAVLHEHPARGRGGGAARRRRQGPRLLPGPAADGVHADPHAGRS
jgi:hypothetical protein